MQNCPDVRDLTTLLTSGNINAVAANSAVRDILNWHWHYLGNPGIPVTPPGASVAPGYSNYANDAEGKGKAARFALFQQVSES